MTQKTTNDEELEQSIIDTYNQSVDFKNKKIKNTCVKNHRIYQENYDGIDISDKPYYILNRFGLGKESSDEYYIVDIDRDFVAHIGTGLIDHYTVAMVDMNEYSQGEAELAQLRNSDDDVTEIVLTDSGDGARLALLVSEEDEYDIVSSKSAPYTRTEITRASTHEDGIRAACHHYAVYNHGSHPDDELVDEYVHKVTDIVNELPEY